MATFRPQDQPIVQAADLFPLGLTPPNHMAVWLRRCCDTVDSMSKLTGELSIDLPSANIKAKLEHLFETHFKGEPVIIQGAYQTLATIEPHIAFIDTCVAKDRLSGKDRKMLAGIADKVRSLYHDDTDGDLIDPDDDLNFLLSTHFALSRVREVAFLVKLKGVIDDLVSKNEATRELCANQELVIDALSGKGLAPQDVVATSFTAFSAESVIEEPAFQRAFKGRGLGHVRGVHLSGSPIIALAASSGHSSLSKTREHERLHNVVDSIFISNTKAPGDTDWSEDYHRLKCRVESAAPYEPAAISKRVEQLSRKMLDGLQNELLATIATRVNDPEYRAALIFGDIDPGIFQAQQLKAFAALSPVEAIAKITNRDSLSTAAGQIREFLRGDSPDKTQLHSLVKERFKVQYLKALESLKSAIVLTELLPERAISDLNALLLILPPSGWGALEQSLRLLWPEQEPKARPYKELLSKPEIMIPDVVEVLGPSGTPPKPFMRYLNQFEQRKLLRSHYCNVSDITIGRHSMEILADAGITLSENNPHMRDLNRYFAERCGSDYKSLLEVLPILTDREREMLGLCLGAHLGDLEFSLSAGKNPEAEKAAKQLDDPNLMLLAKALEMGDEVRTLVALRDKTQSPK